MRVLVVSDTHIPVLAENIPLCVIAEAKRCQLCLHAGDFIDYSVFEILSSFVETIGVCGNMDGLSIRKKLPGKRIIAVEDVQIGLTHGRGAPGFVLLHVRHLFEDEWNKIDIFIFGHSHQAMNKRIEGKLFFNPGSATDTVFAPYNSYGIIDVEGKKITSEIVKFKVEK